MINNNYNNKSYKIIIYLIMELRIPNLKRIITNLILIGNNNYYLLSNYYIILNFQENLNSNYDNLIILLKNYKLKLFKIINHYKLKCLLLFNLKINYVKKNHTK